MLVSLFPPPYFLLLSTATCNVPFDFVFCWRGFMVACRSSLMIFYISFLLLRLLLCQTKSCFDLFLLFSSDVAKSKFQRCSAPAKPCTFSMTKLYGLGLQISLTPATVAQCKDSPWSCRMTPTMRSSRLLQQELLSRGQHERATTWYDVLLELKLRCPSKLMSSQ